jgi:chromosome segregation ATPase
LGDEEVVMKAEKPKWKTMECFNCKEKEQKIKELKDVIKDVSDQLMVADNLAIEKEQKIKELENKLAERDKEDFDKESSELIKMELQLASKSKELEAVKRVNKTLNDSLESLKQEIHGLRKEKWELEKENKGILLKTHEWQPEVKRAIQQAIQSERDKWKRIVNRVKIAKPVEKEHIGWNYACDKFIEIIDSKKELSEPKKKEIA